MRIVAGGKLVEWAFQGWPRIKKQVARRSGEYPGISRKVA